MHCWKFWMDGYEKLLDRNITSLDLQGQKIPFFGVIYAIYLRWFVKPRKASVLINKTPTNVYLARKVWFHVQQVNNENSWANVDQNLGGSASKIHWSLSKFEYDEIRSGGKDKQKQRGKNTKQTSPLQRNHSGKKMGKLHYKYLVFVFW